jgi:hypothetical protein
MNQMDCSIDSNGNLAKYVSPTNSKYTCQPDETGEMICGTNIEIKKNITDFIPNQPTMVISEINKYGVFYLTFS